jgi:hypothetical protein
MSAPFELAACEIFPELTERLSSLRHRQSKGKRRAAVALVAV